MDWFFYVCVVIGFLTGTAFGVFISAKRIIQVEDTKQLSEHPTFTEINANRLVKAFKRLNTLSLVFNLKFKPVSFSSGDFTFIIRSVNASVAAKTSDDIVIKTGPQIIARLMVSENNVAWVESHAMTHDECQEFYRAMDAFLDYFETHNSNILNNLKVVHGYTEEE